MKRYNAATRLRQPYGLKRYAELMGNHKKYRIKSRYDNIFWEDDTQTFEMGIKQSSSREVTGNLSKSDLDAIDAVAGTKLDIMHLYGTDGLGSVAKYAYVGEVVATPSDVGGVDSILEMTATIVPNTVATRVTDGYTVTYNSSTGKFTVTART